jgi:uncharacterized protein YjbJ (UPF0337 family)
MNWDSVEGKWKQQRGKAMNDWGSLMNDELAAIAGKYQQLVGALQEKLGKAQDDAKIMIKNHNKTVDLLKIANDKLSKLQIKVVTKIKEVKTKTPTK